MFRVDTYKQATASCAPQIHPSRESVAVECPGCTPFYCKTLLHARHGNAAIETTRRPLARVDSLMCVELVEVLCRDQLKPVIQGCILLPLSPFRCAAGGHMLRIIGAIFLPGV